MKTCIQCGGEVKKPRRVYCSDECYKIYNYTWSGGAYSEESRRISLRWRAAKSRALRKGWQFDISKDFLRDLAKQPCIYCGDPNSGIDRVDGKGGYTTNNCVPSCLRCNQVKNKWLSFDQMMIVAEALGWRTTEKGHDPRRGAL